MMIVHMYIYIYIHIYTYTHMVCFIVRRSSQIRDAGMVNG